MYRREGEYVEEAPGYGVPLGEDGVYGREGYEDRREGGYEREGYGRGGYEREGYGRREGEYEREGYGRGPPMYGGGGGVSDLGEGVMDSGIRGRPDYGTGYGRPEGGYAEGYEGYREDNRLEEELEHERRRKREAELAAAAAVGYGAYEHHERRNDEDEYREGYAPEKKHHHLFGL